MPKHCFLVVAMMSGLGVLGGDEYRNTALRLRLVLRVGREGRDGSIPPRGAFVAFDFSNRHLEAVGAVLDGDRVWIGDQVVVPHGVLRRAALGRDEGVGTGVLDAHERRL